MDPATSVDDAIDDVLAHFGIRGMKWGVRRSDAQLAKAAAKAPSEDAVTARKHESTLKKHGVNALDNSQIQQLTTRLQLEQNLSRLTAETKTKSAGRKFAEKVANDAFQSEYKSFLKGEKGPLLEAAITGKMNLVAKSAGKQAAKTAAKEAKKATTGKFVKTNPSKSVKRTNDVFKITDL